MVLQIFSKMQCMRKSKALLETFRMKNTGKKQNTNSFLFVSKIMSIFKQPMNFIKKYLTFFIFVFVPIVSFTRSENLDSLEKRLSVLAKKDTATVNQYNKLSIQYYSINPNKGIELGKNALRIAEEINYTKGIAEAYRYIGANYYGKAFYEEALFHYNTSLTLEKKMRNKQGIASNTMNIALVQTSLSDYSNALSNFMDALKIFEEIKFNKGIGVCLGNIVLVYMETGNYKKAMEFAFKALKKNEDSQNLSGQAQDLSNIGLLYMYQKNDSKSLEYYNRGLEIYSQLKDQRGIANIYGNISGLYENMGNYSKAKEFTEKSIDIYKKLDAKKDLAINYSNLGIFYYSIASSGDRLKNTEGFFSSSRQNYEEAIKCFQESKKISEETGITTALNKNYYYLIKCNNALGHFSEAASLFELYADNEKKYNNQQLSKELQAKEIQFRFERKLVSDSIKNVEKHKTQEQIIQLQTAKIKREKLLKYTFIFGFILILILTLIIYNKYKLSETQKNIILEQKEEVEKQKKLVSHQIVITEQKNNALIDSINYAKRLQESIMQKENDVKTIYEKSILFFKPRELVSGDFYYSFKDEYNYYFAVADCTGHGVPGAMIAMMAYTSLSRCINDEKIKEPNEILKKLDVIITEHFQNNHSERKIFNGLDIALIKIDKTFNNLVFSGANRPLWLRVKEDIIEYNPNSRGIGEIDQMNDIGFQQTEIELKGINSIILFTDGYPDQLGEENKKLNSFRFKQIINRSFQIASNQRKSFLDEELKIWQKEKEQTDDICIMILNI